MIWDDQEESNGKAYIVGQWEAGTRVYRSRKEARSGMTERSPMGRLMLWDNRKLGLRCTDLGWTVL